MRSARASACLVAALLLPGCTLLGGESTDGPDRTEYEGGQGFALRIANNASDPIEFTLIVVDGVANEHARIDESLDPGEKLEKWFSFPRTGLYTARLTYRWSGTGAAAQGIDEQRFDANECPEVWLLTWSLEQQPGAIGHRFQGKTCVAADA